MSVARAALSPWSACAGILSIARRVVGGLFADIRGFTEWSEKRSPAEVTGRLQQFYALASRVRTRDDAFLEFIDDQVMALCLRDFPSLGDGPLK